MIPAPLLFHCAKTVSEPHPVALLFERKQIPRIVVTIRNSRKPIDRLEPISLPWAQGVVCSNHTAPTNLFNRLDPNNTRVMALCTHECTRWGSSAGSPTFRYDDHTPIRNYFSGAFRL
jgi:hypothetical protein